MKKKKVVKVLKKNVLSLRSNFRSMRPLGPNSITSDSLFVNLHVI